MDTHQNELLALAESEGLTLPYRSILSAASRSWAMWSIWRPARWKSRWAACNGGSSPLRWVRWSSTARSEATDEDRR